MNRLRGSVAGRRRLRPPPPPPRPPTAFELLLRRMFVEVREDMESQLWRMFEGRDAQVDPDTGDRYVELKFQNPRWGQP